MVRCMQRAAKDEGWSERDRTGPSALVLAPTRELAQQIHGQLQALLEGSDLRASLVLGGETIQSSPELLAELFRGVHCIVATPGRLLNLLDKKKTHLRKLQGGRGTSPNAVLVLDEADRMLGMARPHPPVLPSPPRPRCVQSPAACGLG